MNIHWYLAIACVQDCSNNELLEFYWLSVLIVQTTAYISGIFLETELFGDQESLDMLQKQGEIF